MTSKQMAQRSVSTSLMFLSFPLHAVRPLFMRKSTENLSTDATESYGSTARLPEENRQVERKYFSIPDPLHDFLFTVLNSGKPLPPKLWHIQRTELCAGLRASRAMMAFLSCASS